MPAKKLKAKAKSKPAKPEAPKWKESSNPWTPSGAPRIGAVVAVATNRGPGLARIVGKGTAKGGRLVTVMVEYEDGGREAVAPSELKEAMKKAHTREFDEDFRKAEEATGKGLLQNIESLQKRNKELEAKLEASSSQLSSLFTVATDDEAVVIRDLAVKAGLLWRCSGCGYHNDPGNDACDECGKDDEVATS